MLILILISVSPKNSSLYFPKVNIVPGILTWGRVDLNFSGIFDISRRCKLSSDSVDSRNAQLREPSLWVPAFYVLSFDRAAHIPASVFRILVFSFPEFLCTSCLCKIAVVVHQCPVFRRTLLLPYGVLWHGPIQHWCDFSNTNRLLLFKKTRIYLVYCFCRISTGY